jgi:AmmeMemoRadiSam system protein B
LPFCGRPARCPDRRSCSTDPPDVCRELGECLAQVILGRWPCAGAGRPLLVASTDMTHYEPDRSSGQDRYAITAIERLIRRNAARQHRITMCGFATVTVLQARALGATAGTLVRYATSGDISCDRDRVVGYAGLVIA